MKFVRKYGATHRDTYTLLHMQNSSGCKKVTPQVSDVMRHSILHIIISFFYIQIEELNPTELLLHAENMKSLGNRGV